jgi:hypothetical protein
MAIDHTKSAAGTNALRREIAPVEVDQITPALLFFSGDMA